MSSLYRKPTGYVSIFWVWLWLVSSIPAAPFAPPLDQTREAIVGTGLLNPAVPIDAIATNATLPAGRRNVLTEMPGKPFRQVDPPPEALSIWKLPFYAVLGLPRDLIDGFMGGLAFVPILSNFDYAVYELVPTQILMRDPHDWHRWSGAPNSNGHGFYEGEWGWFPTARAWKLKHPSESKAKRNAEYNAKLQKQLDELNNAAEAANQNAAKAQRDTRQAALEALQTGKAIDPTGAAAGKTATDLMIPYYQTTQLDEGSFALLIASLAVYENSPKWAEDLLWVELLNAPPTRLEPARRLLQEMAATYKVNLRVRSALILTDMLLGDPDAAFKVAQDYMDRETGRPMRNRLVFETALAAGKADDARAAFNAMRGANQFADQLPLMQDRLNIATGQLQAARKNLAARVAERPADPYFNYYLGVADLRIAQQGATGYEASLNAAQFELQKASQGVSPFVCEDAKQALSLANQIKADLAKKPDLSETAPITAPAEINPLKPEKPANEKKQSTKSPFHLNL